MSTSEWLKNYSRSNLESVSQQLIMRDQHFHMRVWKALEQMFRGSREGLRSKHRLWAGPTPCSTGCGRGGWEGKRASGSSGLSPHAHKSEAKATRESMPGSTGRTRSSGLEECCPLGKPRHFQVSHWSELSSCSCRLSATPSLGRPKSLCSSLTCLPSPHTRPERPPPPRLALYRGH